MDDSVCWPLLSTENWINLKEVHMPVFRVTQEVEVVFLIEIVM